MQGKKIIKKKITISNLAYLLPLGFALRLSCVGLLYVMSDLHYVVVVLDLQYVVVVLDLQSNTIEY